MKSIIRLLSLPLLLVSLLGCAKTNSASDFSSEAIETSLPKDVTISFNALENINIYNEWQQAYIDSDNYESTGVASGTIDWSRPLPIKLSWTINGLNKDEISSYKLFVYEDSKLIKEIDIAKDALEAEVTNFKKNITYRLLLKAYIGEEVVSEANSQLIVDQKGPRLMDVDGVENMRDLGGEGILQGLIYRSGRLSNDDGKDKISAAGKETMLKELAVKTEIDLRRYDETGGITVSPLGDSVTYEHLPMVYGGNNIATYKGTYQNNEYNNPAQINRFFTLLSDRNNYPIVFHCSIGKDRTGCLAYLLEGLLGMNEEHLYRDYLFSNFAEIGSICKISDINGANRYGQTIKSYEGENINEKITNFLLSETIGLNQTTLNSVINILKDTSYGK